MIQVHRDLNSLPAFNKAVITIGSFDGVHTGHQQIIKQLKAEASVIGGETIIITFYPHPRKVVLKGSRQVKTLNTLKEKIDLLDLQGIEHLVIVPFNEEFSNQSPEEYVEHFLVKKFQPHTLIIGYDHRFGKGRAGDYHLLEDLSNKFAYQIKEIPEHVLHKIIVSSTQIRDALLNGELTKANELLGYAYFFSGEVVEGNKLGRTIGYPTANLHVEDEEKLVPANGVYAVQICVDGKAPPKQGMMNIGLRPTVNGSGRVIEVNIFDFSGMIYGKTLRISTEKYLRKEVKFNGLEELKAQLALDKENAKSALK